MRLTHSALCLALGVMSLGHAAAQDHVTIRYGFVATGEDGVWINGRDKGFFKRENIDVEFKEGNGSATVAQTVAAGTDDFGIDIDGGAFLTLAAKGLPATAVFCAYAKSPITLLSAADKNLKTPQDFVGKTIAAAGGGGAYTLLPMLWQVNHVDPSKVSIVTMQAAPSLTALLGGRVDGVATNIVVKASLEARGFKSYALMYSDFGVVMPGQYLIVSNALLHSKPDLVARVVKAVQMSLADAQQHPDDAAAAFHRQYPNYSGATALAEIKLLLPLVQSPTTVGKPVGTVSIDDANAGLAALAKVGAITKKPDATTLVTDRFVK